MTPKSVRRAEVGLAAYGPPSADTLLVDAVNDPLIRYRTFALVGFCVASLLDGVVQTGSPAALRIASVLAMGSGATMWCIVDASLRGGYFLHSLRWITMWTWPVAVPIYLLWSRRGRGVLLVGLFFALCVATQALGLLAGGVLRGGGV